MSGEPDEAAADLSALKDEFRASVGAWTIFGMILVVFAMIGLAMIGFNKIAYEMLLVVWISIPLLIGCGWVWRRQIVPVRIKGETVSGPKARRWAVVTAIAVLALNWAQIASVTYAPIVRRAIIDALASDPPLVPGPAW
ncbi:hypothetical protein [Sandarakinorhabdus sp.]|uniref:hypothetical protein n=1 Tax=Sandarakinorhabdus sp. TaxID=1916663 RepID=UPI00286DBB6D|nr:hypothetical protein [Sandarakinorhabdus sp.]